MVPPGLWYCVPYVYLTAETNRPAKYEWKIRDQPTKLTSGFGPPQESDRPMKHNDSQNQEAYDSDEWSTGQRGLDGGLATGQAEFDVPSDEHEPELEPERNPGGLLSDEREPAGSGEHEQATLVELSAEEQRDDGQQGLDGFDGEAFDFDEYGPTCRRSLPLEEYATLPMCGRDSRELPGTGLDPWDLKLVSGVQPTNRDIRNDRHPDDKHDPNAHKAHGEAMARAEALEQAVRPRQYERGDR